MDSAHPSRFSICNRVKVKSFARVLMRFKPAHNFSLEFGGCNRDGAAMCPPALSLYAHFMGIVQ
jgi:hypothetical protein